MNTFVAKKDYEQNVKVALSHSFGPFNFNTIKNEIEY